MLALLVQILEIILKQTGFKGIEFSLSYGIELINGPNDQINRGPSG